MKSNQPSPVWPYLGILVGLFAIAVSAPRGWERLARRESIQMFLDRHPSVSADRYAASTDAPAAEPAPSPVALAAQPRETVVEPLPPVDSVPSSVSRVPAFAASLSPAENRLAADDLSSDSPTVDRLPVDGGEVDAPPVCSRSEAAEPPVGQQVESRVPRPETLFALLRRLSSAEQTAAWANSATGSLEELCSADAASQPGSGPRPVPVVLAELRQIGRQGEFLAKTLGDARLEAQLLRVQYALMRRLEIWEVAYKLAPAARGTEAPSPAEVQAFAAMLERVNQQVREQKHSAAWHEYLQLDRIADLARRSNPDPGPVYLTTKPVYETRSASEDPDLGAQRRQAARQVLDRLAAGRLSREQRHYVEAAPIVAFETGLRSWAAEAVDPQTLLADLERYEQTDKSTDARRLADDCRHLSWSPDPAVRRLGAVVDERYRNANVRLAVAAPFLNRFVPQPAPQVAPFRDVIVGADVTGRSTTLTRLTVLLVPDPQRLRLGLEAHGVVTSSTAATSGPATFYNNGRSQFVVRKLFLCDTHGLNVFPAVAEAEATRSDLVSMETNYDGVPLVGSMVRNIARSQHEELQDEARWQTEHKVTNRARTQLDAEISKAVDKLKDRFNRQLWETLARLDLELHPLALSTTEDRAVLRLRLAGGEQLGAYTPRPRAPSDSLMSLQVHESALNNALERLELDGHSFKLPALFAHLRDKLNRPAADEVDVDLPEDVVVTFAAEDAVRVSCHDGRVQVRLAFAELSEGRRHWRNFAVCTHYRPDTTTLDVHFVRDGTIFLEGESLKGKPQVTLRSIFSKVLSAQRGWGLLSPEFATDPRLEDVTISQFTVDEGWIGLAYAQRPTAGPLARKPK
jgi:hypothetical protein